MKGGLNDYKLYYEGLSSERVFNTENKQKAVRMAKNGSVGHYIHTRHSNFISSILGQLKTLNRFIVQTNLNGGKDDKEPKKILRTKR